MKTRLLLLAACLVASSSALWSQTTDAEKDIRTVSKDSVMGWKTGGILGLNISQASFTNWAAGGQNTVAIGGLVNLFAKYKSEKDSWDSMLDLGYGLLKQGKDADFIKTDDKVDFTSKYGRKASSKWYYAGLVNFKTQMTAGYNYPNDSVKISDLLAPAYVLAAIGMDYKPSDKLTAFIAPITSKNTIVNNELLANAGAFGVDKAVYDAEGNIVTPGKKSRSEVGGYVRMVYQQTFFKDKSVSIISKLDLFSNYKQNPQNIDVSWETIIGLKVNKYITTTITSHLLYDNDIAIAVDRNNDGITDGSGPRTQFKEVIGVGFNYKF
ncbi:MAG: DUF3078 domain-containing protein [Flavobacteriales bacterium]|jgi:hypothetical protein